jgi:hypothetical protein
MGLRDVNHQGVELCHGYILPKRPALKAAIPLLIRRPRSIMGMYTDWGNLKVVSCRAWLEGRTRLLNSVP